MGTDRNVLFSFLVSEQQQVATSLNLHLQPTAGILQLLLIRLNCLLFYQFLFVLLLFKVIFPTGTHHQAWFLQAVAKEFLCFNPRAVILF